MVMPLAVRTATVAAYDAVVVVGMVAIGVAPHGNTCW